MPKGKFIDTTAEPHNILQIWNKLHALDQQLTDARSTIADQKTQLADFADQLTTANQQIQQAMINAGTPTSPDPSGSGGGGGGGGGGDTHPNYYSYIVTAKAELVALSEDLTGPCGAFKIVKRAAQNIFPSDPTVGVLDKPSGNNCGGYATDIICFNDGVIYDVLIDGGGANTPNWSFSGSVPTSRYRTPPP